MKKIIILIVIILSVAGWYLFNLRQDRGKTIKVLKVTPLYKDSNMPQASSSFGNVEPNENLKVLEVRYLKDHMAIQVERVDGSTGWIIPDGSVELK